MARTFAYLRVSTSGQTTENQKQQIAAAGIEVEDHRIVAEIVSGGVAAMERTGFARLVDRLPDWNRWVAVERLAADRPRLERLAAAYRAPARNHRNRAELSARLALRE